MELPHLRLDIQAAAVHHAWRDDIQAQDFTVDLAQQGLIAGLGGIPGDVVRAPRILVRNARIERVLAAAQRCQHIFRPLDITIYLFTAFDLRRREVVVLEQTIGEGTIPSIGVLVERERLALTLQVLEVAPFMRLVQQLFDQIGPLAAGAVLFALMWPIGR